ncbi:hypothetical protein CRYUN_Cryun24cG0004300 [Craigia yunnanensis]
MEMVILSDPNANSTAIFTIMVQGLPKSLGVNKSVLLEYFQYRYPGKVYRVILPKDLCALDNLATELVKFRDEITWLVAKIDSRLYQKKMKLIRMALNDEEKLRKLQELRAQLETELAAYKEGRAQGAGVALVMFKDLQRNQWKVERAPLATDIYWNHLGSTKLSLKLRRSAARIINVEAIDNAQLWLAWVQSSSWLASLVFQFLPNVIIFVSMCVVVPSALSYLSKFERHLTVSYEQRAALLKMVYFFLANLILPRALIESSLESAILQMGRCYLDGEDCKRIEQYMSASLLSRSCLSSLAFLSQVLSWEYLLAPIPWIKRSFRSFGRITCFSWSQKKSEEYPLENQDLNSLRRPMMPESVFDSPRMG